MIMETESSVVVVLQVTGADLDKDITVSVSTHGVTAQGGT